MYIVHICVMGLHLTVHCILSVLQCNYWALITAVLCCRCIIIMPQQSAQISACRASVGAHLHFRQAFNSVLVFSQKQQFLHHFYGIQTPLNAPALLAC